MLMLGWIHTFISGSGKKSCGSVKKVRIRNAMDRQHWFSIPPLSLCCKKNIVDEFTCEGKRYGYYADVANDCQIFHICYPVQYPDGQEEMFKWSFICPNQTVFDQVLLKGQSHEI